MATHSNILVWRIPWTEEPGRLPSMGSKELDTTQRLNHYHTHLYKYIYLHTHTLLECVQQNSDRCNFSILKCLTHMVTKTLMESEDGGERAFSLWTLRDPSI